MDKEHEKYDGFDAWKYFGPVRGGGVLATQEGKPMFFSDLDLAGLEKCRESLLVDRLGAGEQGYDLTI